MIIQNFDLNLIPDSAPVVVHCDQYDRGTGRLVISLYEGSIAYSPSGTAVIQGVKPDGKGFDYNCTLSGNTVTADLTEQMTAVAGQVRAQIVVTESTGRTGTFVFILDVQRSALPADTDMSESDYQMIEQAIEAAQDAVEDSEAWAVGERSGQPVPSTDETYHNNAKYWAEMASQYAQGGIIFRGSVAFASIPTTGMSDGDMYNITNDFTTDSRFIEGAGKECAAGTNIVWIEDAEKWDIFAMSKIGSLNDLNDVDINTPTDSQGLVYNANTGKWENKNVSVSDMTLATKGVGKPDGITTDVSSGTFSAKGVGIVADVNSGGTVHGADWLYYTGTTTVITPNASQMYRVTISGTASLWYWDGTQYVQLASSGGGSGASLVDVTTAQYNALTPAEKADPDTWYWINDMDGMSGTAIVIGTFAGLTDTNFTNLQNGQVAVYNATTQKWENQTPSGGVSDLDDLDDVSITSPASGQYLKYNGSNWENADVVIPSGDYYELVDGTNIASGTNLDNLTTVGTYTKRAQSFKATNEPSDLTQYERYNLIVQMADNTKTVTTGSPLMQILYAHTRNTGEIKVYTRGYTVPVGWSAWQSIGSGGSSGGDYVGLYGMTEIQSSDGQGTTRVDLNDYTTIGNYFCDGKAEVYLMEYGYVGSSQTLGGAKSNAVFLLYVRKISDTMLRQDLYLKSGTSDTRHYHRHATLINSAWSFEYAWHYELETGYKQTSNPGISLRFGSVNDVHINAQDIADNDILVFNSSYYRWENKPLSGYISNPNLLDNPWFTINQRGATTVSTYGYGVDRWAGIYTVNSSGNGVDFVSTNYVIQKFEESVKDLLHNNTVTLSVMLSDGTIYSGTNVYKKDATVTYISSADADSKLTSSSFSGIGYGISITALASITIRAIKLELGSISTLALDTAPNYATELLKCMRYFYRPVIGATTALFQGINFNTTQARFGISLPTPMRTTPTITHNLGTRGQLIVGGTNKTVSDTMTVTINSTTPNMIVVAVDGFTGLTADTPIIMKTNNAYINLSADL